MPYFRIGETFMALGQFQEAKHAYETCLEMDKNFTGVHVQLAEIYEKEENSSKEQRAYGPGDERRTIAY